MFAGSIHKLTIFVSRLLNLGHLLVITQADGQSKHFKKATGCMRSIPGIISSIMWIVSRMQGYEV